jgi:hypothetical protein
VKQLHSEGFTHEIAKGFKESEEEKSFIVFFSNFFIEIKEFTDNVKHNG